MAATETLAVEVAFALPEKQRIVTLAVAPGTTARQAVSLSRIAEQFPELPADTFDRAPLGIFGKALRQPEAQALREGDRVEIYRPLQVDPKTARRRRAAGG
ncbi:RnfH family protein [Halomonas sp. H5]|uniref:RnfH family protein n=1 Tax=Halomonas sp. H5 TaxID=3423910 RepID=UPI003D362C7F